uniref:Uncharacterized protein n=1 Tax=Anopheles albimanus TaxID=7167 RepID=A0A182FTP1_ANOAL
MTILSTIFWLEGSYLPQSMNIPLYNHSVDMCAFFKRPAINRVLAIIHRTMKQYGNMPTGCPLTGPYRFCNIPVSHMRIPPFLLPANFRLQIGLTSRSTNEKYMTFMGYGMIKKVPCTPHDRC